VTNDEFHFFRDAAGWVAAACMGVYIALKRAGRIGAQEDARREHERAAESLIKGLRTELERLGRQNGKLADNINELQHKLVEINAEVEHLRAQNATQGTQIASLSSENTKLHDELALLHAEVRVLRQSATL
jgi:chromosome segregation ATPase